MTSALVVPIAGMSSRFRGVTNLPKWSLEVGGRSILDRSLRSILPEYPHDRVLLVALESHRELLKRTLSAVNLNLNLEVVHLPYPVSGQAVSVREGLRIVGWSSDLGLTIWNGDTGLDRGWSEGLEIQGNFLLGSNLSGDHWSFIDSVENRVIRTEEKVRISNLASLGLYRFREIGLFNEALAASQQQAEHYVAPLYNYLIQEGECVSSAEIDSNFLIPFGTPEEVLESCRFFGWDSPF